MPKKPTSDSDPRNSDDGDDASGVDVLEQILTADREAFAARAREAIEDPSGWSTRHTGHFFESLGVVLRRFPPPHPDHLIDRAVGGESTREEWESRSPWDARVAEHRKRRPLAQKAAEAVARLAEAAVVIQHAPLESDEWNAAREKIEAHWLRTHGKTPERARDEGDRQIICDALDSHIPELRRCRAYRACARGALRLEVRPEDARSLAAADEETRRHAAALAASPLAREIAERELHADIEMGIAGHVALHIRERAPEVAAKLAGHSFSREPSEQMLQLREVVDVWDEALRFGDRREKWSEFQKLLKKMGLPVVAPSTLATQRARW